MVQLATRNGTANGTRREEKRREEKRSEVKRNEAIFTYKGVYINSTYLYIRNVRL
jgi:hypothetical protein